MKIISFPESLPSLGQIVIATGIGDDGGDDEEDGLKRALAISATAVGATVIRSTSNFFQ